jgi:hypothetical protein
LSARRVSSSPAKTSPSSCSSCAEAPARGSDLRPKLTLGGDRRMRSSQLSCGLLPASLVTRWSIGCPGVISHRPVRKIGAGRDAA